MASSPEPAEIGADPPGRTTPAEPTRQIAGPVAVALLGLALSALLGLLALSQDRERQRAAVLRDAETLEASLGNRLASLENRVRSVAALMTQTRGYDPAILAVYDSLVQPGSPPPWRAVGVAPLLAGEDRSSLESRVSRHRDGLDRLGYPPFDVFPDTSAYPELGVIVAVQPASSRQNVFGYDMMSDSARRQAVLNASASGLVELSPPVTLSQDSPDQDPSLLLVSAFRRPPAPMAPLGPDADSVGVVATSFTPAALVEAALEELSLPRARLTVSLTAEEKEILTFPARGASAAPRAGDAPDDGVPIRFTVAGETHQWEVRGTLRSWEPVSPTVPGAVAAGLLVTAMTLLLLLRERGERNRLRRELESQARELKSTEAQAARYQRSEALGRLTGGIAHDFNNLLSVILGNLELMESTTGDGEGQRPLRRQATRAAQRAAALTQNLLTFGRRAQLAPRPVELGRLLTDLTPILRTSVPENLELQVESPGAECWVRVDAAQLESAVLNLVVNARDACRPGDRIRVSAQRNPDAQAPETVREADALVALMVTDSGKGMSAEVLDQAMDPFFTTKAGGRGTGLGLATAAGFIRQSGGELEIDSTAGRGTLVRIWIPLSEPGVDNGGTADGENPARQPAGLRVLVVEDEEPVRQVLTRGLEWAGWRVQGVADGDAALAVLEGDDLPDAVLSDVVMPGSVSGREVARAARARGIPVALMSGYAGGPETRTAAGEADVFLQKPVRLRELAAVMAELIGSSRPGPDANGGTASRA